MTNEVWNRLQLELYEMLKGNSDEVLLTSVIDSYKSDIDGWKEFIDILNSKVKDFDDDTSIRSVQEHCGYLMIKFNIWDYLIVDLNNKRTLGLDEVESIFGEKFFMENFKEEQIGLSNYYFYDSDDVSDIIDFYNSNRELLSRDRVIRYGIENELGRIGIDFNLVKNDITLYIHGFGEMLRVNYLFFDGNLNPRGVSNPSGNMDDLRVIANDLKNISVSKSMLRDRVKELKLD